MHRNKKDTTLWFLNQNMAFLDGLSEKTWCMENTSKCKSFWGSKVLHENGFSSAEGRVWTCFRQKTMSRQNHSAAGVFRQPVGVRAFCTK